MTGRHMNEGGHAAGGVKQDEKERAYDKMEEKDMEKNENK
jgi:hypothetical protein